MRLPTKLVALLCVVAGVAFLPGLAENAAAAAKGPGPGTETASPTAVGTNSTGNDLAFKYTAPPGALPTANWS